MGLETASEKERFVEMATRYCKARHEGPAPCPICAETIEYRCKRIERCPYKLKKTPCYRCRIQCHNPEMRARVDEIERFSKGGWIGSLTSILKK